MSRGRSETVSVIVAFHNRAGYLDEAIRSVLAEPSDGLDIILVDDGSTDRAPEVAAAFGPPTRVIRQDQAGCAQAWNTGLEHARGEFVTFCDSDDLWEPGRMAASTPSASSSGGFANGAFSGNGRHSRLMQTSTAFKSSVTPQFLSRIKARTCGLILNFLS